MFNAVLLWTHWRDLHPFLNEFISLLSNKTFALFEIISSSFFFFLMQHLCHLFKTNQVSNFSATNDSNLPYPSVCHLLNDFKCFRMLMPLLIMPCKSDFYKISLPPYNFKACLSGSFSVIWTVLSHCLNASLISCEQNTSINIAFFKAPHFRGPTLHSSTQIYTPRPEKNK